MALKVYRLTLQTMAFRSVFIESNESAGSLAFAANKKEVQGDHELKPLLASR